MDKLDRYRSIVQQILKSHADQPVSIGQIETAALFDEEHDQYLVLDWGWDRTGRVHSVALHVRLSSGKVWIEVDETETGIADELIEAGIAQADIVLGFYRPERRALTEFAAV